MRTNLLICWVFIFMSCLGLTWMFKTCVEIGIQIQKHEMLETTIEVLIEQVKMLRIQNEMLRGCPADPVPDSDFREATFRLQWEPSERSTLSST